MAWLLPGLPLLLAGRFTVGLMVAIWVPLAAAFTVAVLVFGVVPWPHRRTPWWSVAAVFAIAAGFAVWQAAVHSQQVIVRRDPATYLQFGYWIARHGSLPVPQLRSAFGGAPPGLSFASLGFYQHGTAIVPQFMAGLPIILAAAFWINGIQFAVLMAPVIGACAVFTFGGLAGRLCGPRWAPLGALVLALSLPEQYTSRSTFSEPLAQILLFGGLCLVTDALCTTTARRAAPAAGGTQPRMRGAAWLMAALGGLAFGLSTLVRIDGMSDILPVILLCGVLYATRRQLALPLAAGLAIGAAYGLADGYALSRPYLNSLASLMRPLGYAAAGFAAATAAVMAASRWGRLPQLRRGRWSWVPNIAAVAVVLVMAGFAIRPLFQTARGETNPVTIAFIALVQKLAHLPIDPHRTYAEDSLYWVIWYIGLPAVLLATFGAALLARRFLRGPAPSGPALSGPALSGPALSGPALSGPALSGPALSGPAPSGPAPSGPALSGGPLIWGLPVMVIGWSVVTTLWKPGIVADQPWASRRLVPVVLPGLVLFAVWTCAWLVRRARARGAGPIGRGAVAAFCGAALLLPAAVTTFGLGLGRAPHGGIRIIADGLAFKRTDTGEITVVNRLCRSIGPRAAVVIVDPLTADRFTQIVRGMCGVPAARLNAPAGPAVARVVAGIQRAGRRPVLLAARAAQLAPYGGRVQRVVYRATRQDEHRLTQPPTTTWRILYQVWMSEPGGQPVP